MRLSVFAVACCLGLPGILRAQGNGPAAPSSIPGLTDRLGLDKPQKPSDLLGEPFESLAAGISFRPPANCKEVTKTDPDNIVEYLQEERQWLLKVTRARLGQAVALQTVRDAKGAERRGLLDYTLDDIRKTYPTAELLRKDIVNVGPAGVGILIVRVGIGNDKYLRQQAIYQSSETLYYVLNLTSPAGTGKAGEDAREVVAAETFKQMVDSIQPLDRGLIRQDQVERLYRTRALFTDWKARDGARLKEAIVPEQWLRLTKEGKDIGYSYVVEEYLDGKDVKNNPRRAFDGVLVSIRSRSLEGKNQVDIGSQLFTSLDRKHEDWAHIVNIILDKGQKTEDKKQNMEFGYSELMLKRIADRTVDPAELRKDQGVSNDPNLRDRKNPIMQAVENYTLRVEHAVQGRNANPAPEVHSPAPWYLPQAVGSMLPRLLPLGRPTSYLFQSYISESHEVIHRYVDVGVEKEVTVGGRKVRAVPITDRIRLEGSPTIHYVTHSGQYLGSVNEEAKIEILPTSRDQLVKIWGNPDLAKPDTIERPAPAEGR